MKHLVKQLSFFNRLKNEGKYLSHYVMNIFDWLECFPFNSELRLGEFGNVSIILNQCVVNYTCFHSFMKCF